MNTNTNPNTNIDPRDIDGNLLIVGNHYRFRFRDRDLLKTPSPQNQQPQNQDSMHSALNSVLMVNVFIKRTFSGL